ncbi:hypothetical protein CO054_01770 [Candidatus Shapirobacteria bacterium CG_4_9_14_0_2_um_filter_39_11]|uniref:Uncharacterized protein n=1 Tax=Candidatus Shapirobacteria bacterium CG_4_9_14_0_2_um_filter_39_11 TaxID=1974478 RepID=A0A2M8ESN8_9BACT|nr:MAG: hypothetical protein CO054_01770 [Candidatus Shapirobacteria bacterium CG_4_9_14_0_2_um_filter_39_11]
MERVELKPRCVRGEEIILPFPPEKATPNLSKEERHELLLAKGNEEVAFANLLKAYLWLVVKMAGRSKNPIPVGPSFSERICVGMTGLWKARRRYEKRENPNPTSAVISSVQNEITRNMQALTGGWRGTPKEETTMISLDDSPLPLRVLREKQGFLEERVCSQVSLSQFFEAVTISYKDYCRERLQNTRWRVETLKGELEKNPDGKKKRIAQALRSAKGVLTILEEENKNGKISRNLTIFFFRVRGYKFPEIGENFGLHRETARQIFNEVKRVALRSPEVLAHLSEITNLPLEEISQKI